jgi:hypothetical protein
LATGLARDRDPRPASRDHRTARIEKDANGDTVAETDYTFDRRNLLTDIDYPGSRWVAETYDDNENLSSTQPMTGTSWRTPTRRRT